MTENTRHEAPDVAELRRLAESATPGPWEAFGAVDERRCERWLGVTTDMRATEAARAGDVFSAQDCTRQDALFIAAANPAVVLALLDESDALAAKVERVRALHFGEYVEDEDQNRCFECGDDWPCPTIRAIDGAES